jgi:hypothetical protein
MTASPARRLHRRGDLVESVATATGPIPASTARRQTCTIIGSPAISASGLPGRRVAAMRAGIRISFDMGGQNGLKWQKVSLRNALICVATGNQKT